MTKLVLTRPARAAHTSKNGLGGVFTVRDWTGRSSGGPYMTFIRLLYENVHGAEVLAEAAFRQRDWAGWIDAIRDLMDLVDDLAEELRVIRLRTRRNPSEYPKSPESWRLLVEVAIRNFNALRRQARRAEGKVDKTFFRKMLAKLSKSEQIAVLMARRMKADFLEKWPNEWTDEMERKYWPWYGKKLR